ncbi:aspartyl protease family protein [Ornithobacterium rhinotracheale]|uniref:retropepsin-like aspartic protease n=1 Tax=Ornithobacterium rhinotracheale TaxID=28251 RepID=UPI001FF661FF|nr:aspartyl protease family protein [Ornithobacterium rhinotracheale]MCK0203708.1 aspartyl protease family protein [Ornithobacterium rhinotracheale]
MKLFFLTFLMSIGLFAQESPIASIPFEMPKNRPAVFVEVTINNQPLSFFFDTGATSSLIDTEAAKKLEIQPDFTQDVSGAGGKKTYQIATNQQLKLQSITLDSVNLVIDDLKVFKEKFNLPFNGIIGYDLLKKFKIAMDFNQKEFRLYDFKTKMDLAYYEEIPFNFDNNIPIPQFKISTKIQDQKYTGIVFFDSGAGLSLLLNTPFAQANHLPKTESKKLTSYSQNLSKKSESVDFLAQEIQLGTFSFKQIEISASNDQAGVSAFPNYLGILGAEIINRFNWVFDYENQKLYMKPNANFDKKFPQELAGFKIQEHDGKLWVENLAIESPFYTKGLRNGDEILCINGLKNKQKINDLLQKNGTKIKIKFSQNGKKHRLSHRLSPLL